MDFSLVCRTCLSRDSHTLKPIFTNKSDCESYSKKIFIATGVKIHDNDKLPQNICKNCLNKLNKTHKFRRQCKNTELKLIEIFGKEILKKKHTKNDEIITGTVNDYLSNARTVTDDDDVLKIEFKSQLDTENYTYDDDAKNDLESNNDVVDNNDETKPDVTTMIFSNKYDEDVDIKDNIDSDDDKPLKRLFVLENFNLEEVATKSHNYRDESIGNNYNTRLDNNNMNIFEVTEEPKNLEFQNEVCRTELKNEENKLRNKILDVEDFLMSEPVWKSVEEPEIPYDLIKDPTSDKVTKVYCKLCSKELSIRSIATHMAKRHPGADSRKVKCEMCDSYIMADKLRRHKVMMHGIGRFSCRYCKLDFDTKEKLVDHVKSCTAKKRKRKANDSGRELIECEICNKLMQKASLRMHTAMKHAGLKPVCQHCGRSFGNKFRLNEHYRAKHGYEKFKCKTCEFTSASAMAMKNHERRHRGEKPFVCETCGVKFHASYLLTQHKQSHRTEKLFKCDLCPASFKANNSLHMHKLTCHSNSTYMCTLCCRSYKCRNYALKHVRHVHRYSGNTPPLTVVSKEDVVPVTKS